MCGELGRELHRRCNLEVVWLLIMLQAYGILAGLLAISRAVDVKHTASEREVYLGNTKWPCFGEQVSGPCKVKLACEQHQSLE